MYDELVKKIRHCATDPMHCLSCGEDKDGRCFKRLMTQAADALEELSAIRDEQKAQIILMAAEIEEQQPRWIPVTERLPENGKYLVATHFPGMENEPLLVSVADYAQSLESVDKYDFEGDNRPGWYCYDSEYGFYERKGIRFYMLLPEPPKEE